MPDFRFLGFPEGSPVTMTLTKGADTAGPLTIPAWGQPIAGGGTGEVSISAITDGRLVAPTGVWFQATIGSGFLVGERTTGPNTYDPSFHEIDYEWTIQRPAGAPSTFSTPLNMPAVWNNRNIAYGKQVTITFDVPGSYTVTCTARDWAGNVGVATWTQTVADPEVAFSGANTICFDAGGNFTGAPAGSQQFTDVAAALLAYRNRTGDARFLFRRGSVFTFPDRRAVAGDTGNGFLDNGVLRNTSNLRFGAYGTGAKPRLIASPRTQFIGGTNNDTYSEVAVYDLRFEGDWDAATETGNGQVALSLGSMSTHFLAHRCEFDGHNIAIQPPATTQPLDNNGRGALPTSIVTECVITNFQNMGIFNADSATPEKSRMGCFGTSIFQKPDALGGRPSDKKTSNAHGPIRWSSGQLYLGACDFFHIGGWSVVSSAPGGVADQPCLRIITSAAANNVPVGDFFSNSERIVAEGGGDIISYGATTSNGGGLHVPMNHVLDRFLTVGTAKSVRHVGPASGGQTIRNGIMVQPGQLSADRNLDSMIRFGPNQNEGEAVAQTNYQQRQAVYNVTGVTLRTAAQNESNNTELIDTVRANLWQSKLIGNNVFHAPNQGTPVTADGPFLTGTVPGFTPRYIGYRYNFPFIAERASGNSPSVAPGGTVTFPYPAGTDQAHFTANPLGPRGAVMAFQGNLTPPERVFSYLGDFSLAFTAGGIVLTNTSGATWNPTGGVPRYHLSLDRRSELPVPLASAATPVDLPILWRPTGASPAIGSAVNPVGENAIARDDVLLAIRPAANPDKGAVQVSAA